MNNFTEEEIRVAKQVKDALVNGDLAEELRSVYIAGEICMWDELRSQSPSGANHLIEALEQIRDGAIPINEQQYVSWIATARQIAHSALAQYKSQPGSLQGEQENIQPNETELKKMWEVASTWNDEIAPHFYKGMIKGWRMAKIGIDKIQENEKEVERLAAEYWRQSAALPTPQPIESVTFLEWVGKEGWKWSELNSRWFKLGSDDYLNETQLHEKFKERDVTEEHKSDRESEGEENFNTDLLNKCTK